MFVTEYNIVKTGENLGVLHITTEGFTLPKREELSRLVNLLTYWDHQLIVVEAKDTIKVRLQPHDLTKNEILRPIRLRLKNMDISLQPSL